jgi:hypothetical protein
MTVVSCRERWYGRDGSFHYTFLPSDDTSRHFLILTDNLNDNAVTIGAQATLGPVFSPTPLPLLGSFHPNSPILTVRDWSFKQKVENPYYWDADVQYRDAPLRNPQDIDPLNRAAVISCKTVRYTKTVIQDNAGNPIVNSANDYLEGVEIDDCRYQIEIAKNYPSTGIPSWFLTGRNCINIADWTITQLNMTIPMNCAKISEMEFTQILSETIAGTTTFYRTLKIIVDISPNTTLDSDGNPVGHNFEFADKGYRAIHSSASQDVGAIVPLGGLYKIKVFDQHGMKVFPTQPVYLDGNGGVVADGGDIVILQFNIYNTFDFTNLPVV